MALDCKSVIFMKKVGGLPVLMRQQNHMINTLSKLRHIHLYSKALRHLTADVGLIQVRDEHFRTTTAGSRIKITFRHPVEGEDCSHVYVEHCHQLRHIHLYSKALRHLTADVGLIQESGCQFTCPYEGSKLHFDTLSKVKIVRMFTLNIVT
ncbi:hypothetical protein T12_10216 [Trichinella patagoniensis]|uniref:Uncharacterized protein n=1 Tax=Trichinella patagoniensis TaxID=990121 RepID=A0A0V0ZNN1_9BILA|nr:hypothetical protein T12_10216 [Trichinella patagoniensis]